MKLDGSKIKAFLDRKQKSQEWLARELGCSARTVFSMTQGKPVRADTLMKLAKIMDCPMDELIAKDSPKTK